MESWIPHEEIMNFDPKSVGKSVFDIPASQHYNAMLAPLAPTAIRGVVWYQGEINVPRPATYASFLSTMIKSWRKDFGDPQLPFIVVQLPASNLKGNDLSFTWIREQQAKVAAEVPDVALVVTYDTHDGSDLHPKEKIPIGERVALVARTLALEESLVSHGPIMKSVSIDGAAATVQFQTSGDGLRTRDGFNVVRGFMLAGADGRFYLASGTIKGSDSVSVTANRVSEPQFVRFAWGGVPDANLINRSGLPAHPFRTDELPPADVSFMKSVPSRVVTLSAYELEIDTVGGLASLGTQGEQFISNDLGTAGGSFIPAVFGPGLSATHDIGPSDVMFEYAGGTVTLAYTLMPKSVEVRLENNNTDEIAFHLALAHGVEVDDNLTQFKRGNARLIVQGFSEKEARSDGNVIVKANVPGGGASLIKLSVP